MENYAQLRYIRTTTKTNWRGTRDSKRQYQAVLPQIQKYYDRKASAAPLKIYDYCYILNPKGDNQST